MSRVHIPDQCLEEGCTNPGGKQLLCADHAPAYAATKAPECTCVPCRSGLTHIMPCLNEDKPHV